LEKRRNCLDPNVQKASKGAERKGARDGQKGEKTKGKGGGRKRNRETKFARCPKR